MSRGAARTAGRASGPATGRASGRAAARLAGGTALAGAAVLTGSLLEARSPVLRRVTVPALPAGQPPLRVLHLSDLHLTPRSGWARRWVQGLAALEPDLTVVTGDMLAHRDAVPTVLASLGDLLHGPGAFVLGSNDYHEPTARNPLRYFAGPSRASEKPVTFLPTPDLVAGLTGAGWLDLTNTRGTCEAAGRTVRFVGVDDPHIRRDRMPGPDPEDAPAARAAGVLRLGVAHAPYRRVLDAMTADGSALVLAGHTHGGQVCLPGGRALVTNCDLPPAHAKGLFAWSAPAAGEDPAARLGPRPSSWVHVSAGLGTSPYTPVRLFCRPEATLLTLVAGA